MAQDYTDPEWIKAQQIAYAAMMQPESKLVQDYYAQAKQRAQNVPYSSYDYGQYTPQQLSPQNLYTNVGEPGYQYTPAPTPSVGDWAKKLISNPLYPSSQQQQYGWNIGQTGLGQNPADIAAQLLGMVTGGGPAIGMAGAIPKAASKASMAGNILADVGLAGGKAAEAAAPAIAKTASKLPQMLGGLSGWWNKLKPWQRGLGTIGGATGLGYGGIAAWNNFKDILGGTSGVAELSPEGKYVTGTEEFEQAWPGWTPSYKTSTGYGGVTGVAPKAKQEQEDALVKRVVDALTGGDATGAEMPRIEEINGTKFWWDGQQWRIFEDVMSESWDKQRQQAQADQMALLNAQHQAEMQQLQAQISANMQQLQTQIGANRSLQNQASAENMATMYAAEPYKYWAQMGQLTPEAVAALTGGEVQPGEAFKGTPLSYPSMQWWNNLLPSEQEQILGALNWMGINPDDWLAILQRTIPGLSQRQVAPAWAR